MIDTTVSIESARPREIVTLAGRVLSIEVQPNNAAPTLVARLSDGTGIVEVVFMGRRDIPGLVPGAHLSVTGRLGAAAQLFNPRFELS